MQYLKLGRSNLTVSKICLGTMHFGGVTPEEEAYQIMDKALELGINFFDTANRYGGKAGAGTAEAIIGRWFKQGGGRRDQVVLATKVYGHMADASVPNEERGISAYKVRKHAADSLSRLQTDHIDLYQIHHFDRRISLEEFWTTFERLMNNGDVLYMGTSNFPGWSLAKFQMHALQRGWLGFISEQTQYNLLNRYPELEVIPAVRDFGIGILSYMPLAGGLLTGKKQAIEGSRTHTIENEYGLHLNSEQFTAYSAFCREIDEQEHVVAIAWTLANPAVSSAIVGVRTVAHFEGLERAVGLKLEPGQMAQLDEIFNINRGRPLRPGEAPEAFAW
ncbi:MAG: aldo/keto reductase [Chloroflexi bacterium]|nr:aldo/keto reductase [Chloroflexota bacterium]